MITEWAALIRLLAAAVGLVFTYGRFTLGGAITLIVLLVLFLPHMRK